MSDHSELKRLADAATAGQWKAVDYGSFSGKSSHWYVETDDGKNVAFDDSGDPAPNHWEARGEQDMKYIAAANPAAVLALIAEVEQLKADLQGELSAAKEDARRQRADQIAYRAAVYRLKREAPGEVVGGARLQRLFLISNDNAQILLSAMKDRGDLVEIKEKPWGGMVPSTNSEILGEQP